MAKRGGLGQRFYVEGFDISGDVGSIDTAMARRGSEKVTGIDKSAEERLLLLSDGELSFSPWFNPSAGQEHLALRGLPRTDVGCMWCFSTTLGDAVAWLTGKQVNYDWQRGASGSLKGKVQALANGSPLEWAVLLKAKGTHASAGSDTGLNDSAQTTAGAVGYLQHFSAASGTVTYIIEHSSDSTNGIDGSWTTLMTLAVVATPWTPVSARVVVAGTVKKYVRATTTGVFTTAVFAVAFRRKSALDDN
jgi:hypothetical protein